MDRGFTLLEWLISIIIFMVLLFSAIPDFHYSREQAEILRLAAELHNFMIQAKSESMLRNQDLWVYFVATDSAASTTMNTHNTNKSYYGGEWNIILTDSGPSAIFQNNDDIEQWHNKGNHILFLSGKSYRNIYIKFQYTYGYIRFYGARGKMKNGTITFSTSPSFINSLKIKSSFGASRIVICSTGTKYGRYPSC